MNIVEVIRGITGGRKKMGIDLGKFDVTMLLDAIQDVDWKVIVRTWALISSGALSPNEAVYYVLLAHQSDAVLATVDIDPTKLDEVIVAMAKNIG